MEATKTGPEHARATQTPRPGEVRTDRPPVPPKQALRDGRTLDLELNAIDSFLNRWKAAMERDRAERKGRHELRMAEMARDLQALREWCGRTGKPGLRRAMIVEANRLMQRMERFLAARDLELPMAG